MELSIEKLVYGGDGIARLPADGEERGKAAFVPFVIEGEKIEAMLVQQKPGFARARVQSLLQPSPHRIEASCPYFTSCGGCHYQHMNYDHQLVVKAAILQENLRRIAKLELSGEIVIHPSSPWNYRNRTRLRVQHLPNFALGYHRMNSHQFQAIEQCPISSLLINRTIAQLLGLGRNHRLPEGVQEIELFVDADDAKLILEFYTQDDQLPVAEAWWQQIHQAIPEALGAVAFFTPRGEGEPAGVQKIASFGTTNLSYRTNRAEYRVSGGSFFQVNRFLTDKLVELVVQGHNGGTALDLYAGVGLFSTVLNREFERVIAVESSPISFEDLLYNSPANVKAVRATTEDYLRNAKGKLRPDLIVVDPPRSGLGTKVIVGLVEMKAPRITYVSCDPATLCRDLRGFLDGGYGVERADLLDLFPQTFHLESVLQLAR